jgi:hypothetical protein
VLSGLEPGDEVITGGGQPRASGGFLGLPFLGGNNAAQRQGGGNGPAGGQGAGGQGGQNRGFGGGGGGGPVFIGPGPGGPRGG